ncbi:MAG: RluA family pseudouridine synthase [Erysipelotrichaceae bacterium]|nr:RluA family pseudouridine synthase [Erysipelotrichaceae bacterium]MDY6035399.1 RluA family pseudouridine synthase [Bulleidia sp.]
MKYTIDTNKIVIDTQGKYINKTVEDFLNDYYQSKKNKYLLILNKQIQLNNTFITNAKQIIGNQLLTIHIPNLPVDWLPAGQECKVIYEDAFIYIVHKDAGMIIHSEKDDPTCLNAYAARYQLNHGIHQPVRPIHRLDKDTTGLVIYSKIPFFQPWLDHALATKKIKRHYQAITFGNIDLPFHTTINQKLGRDRHHSGMYRISSTGMEAITQVDGINNYQTYSLLSCMLETGRTHQIRVHLASIHHPIVNDPLYGKKTTTFTGMGLWADWIEFRNPITNKKHRIFDIDNPMYSIFNQ